MPAEKRLLIVGAGGFAREVAWLAESLVEAGQAIRIVGFADDKVMLDGQTLHGYPVVSLEAACSELRPDEFVIAVGSPMSREALATKALAEGMAPATLIHPRVERSSFIKMGNGVVICAGCILTTEIVLGDYVQLNLGCTIGHDAVTRRLLHASAGRARLRKRETRVSKLYRDWCSDHQWDKWRARGDR